jgi:hypothetical protein
VDDAIIAVEMMVRKLEEGYDKLHAATFAYEVTAMPMLTGTLITAAGFLPIGWPSRHRRIHLRHLRGHHGGAGHLLVRVGLLRALPGRLLLHTQALHARARPRRVCSTPRSTQCAFGRP